MDSVVDTKVVVFDSGVVDVRIVVVVVDVEVVKVGNGGAVRGITWSCVMGVEGEFDVLGSKTTYGVVVAVVDVIVEVDGSVVEVELVKVDQVQV